MGYQENTARKVLKVRKNIRGLVLPVEQDEEGNVVVVSIITDDDEEFEVFDDPQGQELCDYLDEEVVASGVVRYEHDGPDRIRLDWFRPVEFEDDLDEIFDDDDDDDD